MFCRSGQQVTSAKKGQSAYRFGSLRPRLLGNCRRLALLGQLLCELLQFELERCAPPVALRGLCLELQAPVAVLVAHRCDVLERLLPVSKILFRLPQSVLKHSRLAVVSGCGRKGIM